MRGEEHVFRSAFESGVQADDLAEREGVDLVDLLLVTK